MKPLIIEGSGTYQIIVKDANGKLKYESPEFKNLIVNQGIDWFMGNNIWDDYAFCGTGGTPPAVTDVGMQAFLAETNDRAEDKSESTFSTPRYCVQKLTYAFPVGGVVGNVAEVGIGWKVGASRLIFSRSLVVDGGGSPTTITVLASEQLTIIYRFYVKVPDTDTTFNIVDNGITYTITQRANFRAAETGFTRLRYGFWGILSVEGERMMLATSTDVLPAIDGTFPSSGTSSTSNTEVLSAYTPGSFTRSVTYTFNGANANYAGGIGSTKLYTGGGVGQWMHSYSPKINKIAGQSLALTFTYTFVRGVAP